MCFFERKTDPKGGKAVAVGEERTVRISRAERTPLHAAQKSAADTARVKKADFTIEPKSHRESFHPAQPSTGPALPSPPPLRYTGTMYKARSTRPKTYPQPVNTVLTQWMSALDSAVGQSAQGRLVRLWRHWDMVMGPQLAPIAWPLGHRGTILLVGGEDAMIMQELSMQTEEILERVNAFMDEALFTEVRVSLALGKNPLNGSLAVPPPRTRPVLERGPAPSGMYLTLMDPDSAVAKCYARFAAPAQTKS